MGPHVAGIPDAVTAMALAHAYDLSELAPTLNPHGHTAFHTLTSTAAVPIGVSMDAAALPTSASTTLGGAKVRLVQPREPGARPTPATELYSHTPPPPYMMWL